MNNQELAQLDRLVEKLRDTVNARGDNPVLTEAVDVVMFYVGIEHQRNREEGKQ